jgi:hypothetical protein
MLLARHFYDMRCASYELLDISPHENVGIYSTTEQQKQAGHTVNAKVRNNAISALGPIQPRWYHEFIIA